MTNAQPPGVVVDTMVISWLFDGRPNPLADRPQTILCAPRMLKAHYAPDEGRRAASAVSEFGHRRKNLGAGPRLGHQAAGDLGEVSLVIA